MPLPATLPAAIVETIVAGLATLFLAGANGDIAAARQAAAQMLAACHPASQDELRLAASLIRAEARCANNCTHPAATSSAIAEPTSAVPA